MARQQFAQNTLARDVNQKSRSCLITPIHFDLHWLPVRNRENVMIATFTFEVSQLAILSCRPCPTVYADTIISISFSLLSMCSVFLHEILQWISLFYIHVCFDCNFCFGTNKRNNKNNHYHASDIWNKLPCHISSISAIPAFRNRLRRNLFSSALHYLPPSFLTIQCTNITFCDVIPFTNVTEVRYTLPPS